MFYGNSDLLEKSLHNDLNTLIKNVKARQDQHLTLLQYNKGLIEQLSEMDSIPFFQEELAKHRSFLESMKASDSKIKQEEDQMLEKYMCTLSGESSIVKLMGRVTARVMEILQASLEKSKSLDEQLQKKYLTLKASLLELVNNKEKIDIQGLLQTIIIHAQSKSKEEIGQLEKIISILISGNFSELVSVYQPIKKQPVPQQKIVTFYPPRDKKENKKKSLDRSREKIDKMREEAKQIEKVKKKKSKLATKMLTTLYSTMQLSKNQFMEDMVFTNREDKKRQLYQQIFSRNKFNHAQILEFQSKRDKFQMKVKAFKEEMEKQSHRIQQALVIHNQNHNIGSSNKETTHSPHEPLTPVTARLPQKNQRNQIFHSRKQTKSEAGEEHVLEEQNNIMPEREKMFRRRDKKPISKIPSPKLVKQATYASMQSTQQGFQHIKFDLKNQEVFSRSNRAKLPQISGRSSLDNRYEQKKKQPQKRINIVKNIQIGTFNPQLKPLVQESATGSERKSPRERPVADTNTGFEYTFYVKKKTNKFYETKNNFLF